jgi:hypothetical protein
VADRPDGAIVSHGVDRSIHGGMTERKELDPNNRGSIVIGSVAFYLDRAGYDVLPLAMGMLQGQTPMRSAWTIGLEHDDLDGQLKLQERDPPAASRRWRHRPLSRGSLARPRRRGDHVTLTVYFLRKHAEGYPS